MMVAQVLRNQVLHGVKPGRRGREGQAENIPAMAAATNEVSPAFPSKSWLELSLPQKPRWTLRETILPPALGSPGHPLELAHVCPMMPGGNSSSVLKGAESHVLLPHHSSIVAPNPVLSMLRLTKLIPRNFSDHRKRLVLNFIRDGS